MPALFKFYRVFISPAIGLAFNINCRFEETCSRYTERMIKENGILRGCVLGAKRIASCNGYN